MSVEDMKRSAAREALRLVENGMRLGLGTGSTANHFIDLLGERVRSGLRVVCVPTSQASAARAARLGVHLSTLDETPLLDLTVDGADELDGALRLIKGGGGALLREKIVAAASERFVVIADHTKKVDMLGAFPLPVEVVRFGLTATRNMVTMLASDLGCNGTVTLRTLPDGSPFITDGGNSILDCAFGQIPEPERLDEALKHVPGVVENGLFLGLADMAFVAGPDGVSVIEAEHGEDGES